MTTDKKIEDKFICQKCESVLADSEAIPYTRNEGEGETSRVYICASCLKDVSDEMG